MLWFEALLFLLLGLVFGSFVNAWVWRTQTDRSVTHGHSMCPHCKHQLAWYDLVPLLSWVALQGKCRYCKKAISVQYPLVELVTGIVFLGLFYAFMPSNLLAWLQLVVLCGITVLLLAGFVYDARTMLLPEKFMLPAIGLGLVFMLLRLWEVGLYALVPQLIALGVFMLVYWGIWFFSRGQWLGAGDLRLAAVMGLVLTPKQLVVGVLAAYFIGAAWGVYLILKQGKNKKARVAFGPFLIIGFYVGLFFGTTIANWYLGFI